jgi:hypothetical protein
VQDSYWQVAADLHTLSQTAESSRLVARYNLDAGSTRVTILALNSAWMSRLNEEQGRLRFPEIPIEPAAESSLVIAVTHHPFNWLESEDARRLRSKLEGAADVILTGHEHDSQSRVVTASGGDLLAFFGPLQSWAMAPSWQVAVRSLNSAGVRLPRLECGLVSL